jgi:hypothetical protein
MTALTDIKAISPTANAKATSIAKGAQITNMMNLLAQRVVEMQRMVQDIVKLHPPTTRSVTIGGTAHAGDVLTLSITPSGGSLIAITYTMATGDTLQVGAINLANLVNANSALQFAGITASAPVAGVSNLSYGLTPTVSGAVAGGGATTTLTVGSASSGADSTNLTALNSVLAELL